MDATPATPYMLLLFGGKLAMPDPARQMVVVDDWLHLHASARVAGTPAACAWYRPVQSHADRSRAPPPPLHWCTALIRRLRQQLDRLLERKLAQPTLSISTDPIVEAITTLLSSERI